MSANAEHLYGLAMRTYPAPYRNKHGAELVDTALELGGGDWSWREMCSLIAQGMRTRARIGTAGDAGGLWMSGLRLGLFLLAIDSLAFSVAGPGGAPSWFRWAVVGIQAGLVLMATFTTGRVYATALTVAMAAVLITGVSEAGGIQYYRFLILTVVGLAATWTVALRSDGRRAAPPITLVPLLAGCWLAFQLAPDYTTYGSIPHEWHVLLYLLIPLAVVAVAVAAFDPRLLAGAVVWLAFGALAASLTESINFDATHFAGLMVVSASTLVVFGVALNFGARRLRQV